MKWYDPKINDKSQWKYNTSQNIWFVLSPISRQQCTNTFTMVIHFVCFLHCDNPLSSYGKKIDKTREHLLKDYQ